MAENQPTEQNRVNEELSFARLTADLRQFIAHCADTGAEAAHSDDVFNALALRLFTLQFSANLPYQKFCQSLGIRPDAVDHWSKISAVPSPGFKEMDLTCLDQKQRTHVFHSSGTTGTRPSRHFHSAESLGVYEASLWPWFKTHLLTQDTPTPALVVLTPPSIAAPHSSLAHMFEHVRKRMNCPESVFTATPGKEGVWELDLERTLRQLQAHEAARTPVMLLGPAFAFVHLLDAMEKASMTLRLAAGSRAMETGGYKGRSRTLEKTRLHASIRARLGIDPSFIVAEYGMSELSSQAYDAIAGQPGPRVFRFPPWARGRVISPETGREVDEGHTGLICVMDLANIYSVMHVQTEDLGQRRGDGFELIGRATAAEPRGCSLMLG